MSTSKYWRGVYLRIEGEQEHEIGRIGTRCALAALLHQSGQYLDELHAKNHDCHHEYQTTNGETP